MPIGLRGLSVNNYMLAYEQAPRQPYTRFRSDRHLDALSATYKNTGLHPSQKWSKTYSAGHADSLNYADSVYALRSNSPPAQRVLAHPTAKTRL